MIALWIAAFIAMAAAAALIVLYSIRPVAVVADPAQTVYLRQLAEFDELARKGLISEEEHILAKAEAGRRALKEEKAVAEKGPTKWGRIAVVCSIGLVGLIALGLYLIVGRPDLPDQPYAQRLKTWEENFTIDQVERLSPAQLAAILKLRQAETPNDPELLRLLAAMQERSGDDLTAIRNLERSLEIDPGSAQAWSMLGQLRARLADGEITPGARQALERARALDPKAVAPRYLIGRAEIEAGRRDAGLAIWRDLLNDLEPERREVLAQEIAVAEGVSAQIGAAAPADPAIQGMVNRLSARLKENPDDPDGWARLVRSYAVLNDQEKLAEALAEARRIFANRPDDLAAIEAAVAAPQ